MRLHAASLLASTDMTDWQRQLSVALISELALWDAQVCDAAAGRTLSELIEPAPWLHTLGIARGWSSADSSSSPAAEWRGIHQRFDSRERTHSAWLAVAGHEDVLAQRVWNGQLATLFPLLERHRRGLLKHYRGLLRLPWQMQSGRIEFLEDLELNHIADQLRVQNSRGLRDIYDFVCWLRDLRNDLAHLSPIPAERLLEPRFRTRLGRDLLLEDD